MEQGQYHSAILITNEKMVVEIEDRKECVSYDSIHGITLVCVVKIMELLVLERRIGTHHRKKT